MSAGHSRAGSQPDTTDLLATTVERINRIPNEYRAFTVSDERARRYHRIRSDLLAQLLDMGLPHKRDGDRLLLDRHDLKNIVLRLSVRSPQHSALWGMADALTYGSRNGVVERTIDIMARCPEPGHPGDCAFALASTVSRSNAVQSMWTFSDSHFQVSIALPSMPAVLLPFSEAHWRLVEAAARLEFHHLPFRLISDIEFTTASGLADCRAAAPYLVHVGRKLGLQIRAATGVFLSRPFANQHCWIELFVDGRWQAADPFFIIALGRWGILDVIEWPANRSPQGAFWWLSPMLEPVITHRGAVVRPSLLTR